MTPARWTSGDTAVRAALVLGLLLAACAPDGADRNASRPGPVAAPTAVIAAAEAFAALPPCQALPEAVDETAADIALLPEAVVTAVDKLGPLVSVRGFIGMTPVAVHEAYDSRDDDALEVIISENEVFEVEILAARGDHRTFLRGRAVCSEGTEFQAVVVSEEDADRLPIPAGAAASRAPTAPATTP